MTKRQAIDEIMRRNPTARPEFLAQFTTQEVEEYLHQLEAVTSAPHAAPRPHRAASPSPCR